MSYRRRLWLTEGRPRGMQFPTFQMYKQEKDIFRTSLNKAYLDYERETYSSLNKACNINHKSLWAKLRSKTKINSIISLNVDNNTITNPRTICNAMADHFSRVFSDTQEDHFDENFKSYVDEKVSELKKKAMTSDEEFNIPASLVKRICSNLPNNKTCGLDVLLYEHIKYGGSYLFFCLARLFTLIIKKLYPSSMASWCSCLYI